MPSITVSSIDRLISNTSLHLCKLWHDGLLIAENKLCGGAEMYVISQRPWHHKLQNMAAEIEKNAQTYYIDSKIKNKKIASFTYLFLRPYKRAMMAKNRTTEIKVHHLRRLGLVTVFNQLDPDSTMTFIFT